MIKILVATDLSERSTPAIQRAGRLLRAKGGGELTLLHVVDNDAPSELTDRHVEEARTVLQGQAGRLSESGVQLEVLVLSGDVDAVIVDTAQRRGVDLLLIGAHRKSALRDFFLGTTVERVIRSSRVPVLRVARPVLRDYTRAMLALDLTPVTAEAFHTARNLGLLAVDRFDAVHAADVLPMTAMPEVVPDPAMIEEVLEQARSKAEQSLRELDVNLPAQQLHVHEGEPRQVIVDAMELSDADLLIIGTNARKGLQRVVLGSVASSVLASLDCDILTVPPSE